VAVDLGFDFNIQNWTLAIGHFQRSFISLWRKRLGMGRIDPHMTRHIKALSSGLTVRCALIFAVTLIAGCSTQHFESTQSSYVVATCIEKGWEQSALSKVPVIVKKQANGYLVVPVLDKSLISILCGSKHPPYMVWAEVTDSNSGSMTTYFRARPIFHDKIDKAVRNCQEPNDCNIPDPEP
jgi:hypothetical protein